MQLLRAILLVVAPLLGQLPSSLRMPAQTDDTVHGAQTADSAGPADVPFGPGERLDYQVKLGVFSVGNGFFRVAAVDTVRGHATYRLEMQLHGGAMWVTVHDYMTSWLDVRSLVSRRFQQDQKEANYKRQRTLEFFPEQKRFEQVLYNESGQVAKNESGSIPSDDPLDDISFLYYARTLPLEVGKTYTLNRYFDEKGNPVTLRVLRRDTVKVPAGRFATIVVQPVIQTKGLFGKGGNAEVYFTDDDRRLVVQVRSSVPIIGHLNMYLRSYTPGERLGSMVVAPGTQR
jgi:hypothetical protein